MPKTPTRSRFVGGGHIIDSIWSPNGFERISGWQKVSGIHEMRVMRCSVLNQGLSRCLLACDYINHKRGNVEGSVGKQIWPGGHHKLTHRSTPCFACANARRQACRAHISSKTPRLSKDLQATPRHYGLPMACRVEHPPRMNKPRPRATTYRNEHHPGRCLQNT